MGDQPEAGSASLYPQDPGSASDSPTGSDGNGAGTLEWHRVLREDELPEGRVTTVQAGLRTCALVHFDGKFAALDNRCPHQGGPLGEGSIENGLLRCPWHGYDYDPLTGTSPGAFDDTATCYPLEIRDGEVFVGVEPPAEHERTVSDAMVETLVNWGVKHVFGMVGHSNLGLADAIRRQDEAGNMTYIGIRPGCDEPPHRALGREGRPLARDRPHRPGGGTGTGPGRLPGSGPGIGVRVGGRLEPDGPAGLQAHGARQPRREERAGQAGRPPSDLPRRRPDDPGPRHRGGHPGGENWRR